MIGLFGLSWLALVLLHHPKLPPASPISLHDLISVLQLVFASVAGAGALVALVMAYRRQRVAETATAHDRTRVLNERFTAIAAQLGDQNPAVRLAGVHAMAGLADDWQENRQTCVAVLCAYLRMPYDPEPEDDSPPADLLAFQGNREVRHTAVRVIAAHLRPAAKVSWQGLDLDFTGVTFDGAIADFSGAVFYGSAAFSGAQFSGAKVDFTDAVFSSGVVNFTGAQFSGGSVDFTGAQFSGGSVDFTGAQFSGGRVDFTRAQFYRGTVYYTDAQFSGGIVAFGDAWFSGGSTYFAGAQFSGGTVSFTGAEFSSGTGDFTRAVFSGGTVSFTGAEFSGATVSFAYAEFSGGTVDFTGAEFSGGRVDFSRVERWSCPPTFGWDGASPASVTLPGKPTMSG